MTYLKIKLQGKNKEIKKVMRIISTDDIEELSQAVQKTLDASRGLLDTEKMALKYLISYLFTIVDNMSSEDLRERHCRDFQGYADSLDIRLSIDDDCSLSENFEHGLCLSHNGDCERKYPFYIYFDWNKNVYSFKEDTKS